MVSEAPTHSFRGASDAAQQAFLQSWSRVVTMSEVLLSCAFISSPLMAFTSSTISFLFLLALFRPLMAVASTGARAKLSSSLWMRVVYSAAASTSFVLTWLWARLRLLLVL